MPYWFRYEDRPIAFKILPIGPMGWIISIVILGAFLCGFFMVISLFKPDEFTAALNYPKTGFSLMFLASVAAFYMALNKTDYSTHD